MIKTAGVTHGWAHVSRERMRRLIEAIVSGEASRGPVHAELDLTDRAGFPPLERGYRRLRNTSRPARTWLERRLRLPLAEAI